MIILIGTFPPPIHGMAMINQALFQRLLTEGLPVEKLNTSPQNHRGNWKSRFKRLRLFLLIWTELLQKKNRPRKIFYLALSGGYGQIYDIVTVGLAHILDAKCVLHHHSMAYLDKKKIITAFLFHLAGNSAVHIVLCEKMKTNLQERYGDRPILILSNLALLQDDEINKKEDGIKSIGYLSNITKEKGGWEAIKLAEAISEKGWTIKFRMAGPCRERMLRKAIKKAQEQGILEWAGSLYGMKKKMFWESVDLFVFPTQYENEAEPLVVWEALLSRIPVLSYDRGCISSQVGNAGLIIKGPDYIESAVSQIELLLKNPDQYKDLVQNTRIIDVTAKKKAEDQWDKFILCMNEILETGKYVS